MRAARCIGAWAIALAFVSQTVAAQPVEEFYRGKQVRVIIADPPCDTSGSGTPPTGITPITIAMFTKT